MLHSLWENVEVPFIVHFESPQISVCKKSLSAFTQVAEIYARRDALFLNISVTTDAEILRMFEEYGFLRFPAILIYDYGEIRHRFDSLQSVMKELEIQVKKALASER
jgi:thiol-disulfide isomerase/thioredoxin